MRLQHLLDAISQDLITRPAEDVEISAPISEDNRTVEPGGVFVARKGLNTDGHKYIPGAVERGVAAVVGEHPPEDVNCPVPYVQVKNAQRVIGPLASAYYDYPSRKLIVVGVTGTDGKTTTTNMLFSILKATGLRVGMISTVSAVIGDEEMPTGLHVTTPTAPEVQWYLRRMVDAGLTHCILETTSFGLDQHRVAGVEYDVAVMTNVMHEHLDIHGSFENYRAAKGMLFQMLSTSYRKPSMDKWAVVNRDDPSADFFLQFPADHKLTYAVNRSDVSLSCDPPVYGPQGTQIAVRGPFGRMDLQTRLVGRFNVENILAASSAAHALACPPDVIKAGIESMHPVPGRMERIDEGQNFMAVVDFAHTPNALKVALQAARAMGPRRIICVFGSAGLRDREKRRLMSEVSAELADITVLTAEDPRTESLDVILQTMAEAMVSKGGVEGKTFYRVPDRGEAITFACSLAQPGDMVIACGKGHEQSMCFGTTEYPWDDRDAMRAALRGQAYSKLPTAKI